jgi:predicted NUDIX family NTP pyrophosphohydrolase
MEWMKKLSAGILAFRRVGAEMEVFLVHPGGPFWAKKDEGAWSIPKGEYAADEDPFHAAKREFHEETGFAIHGDFVPLGQVKQAGGKIVTAWAVEYDLDPAEISSNTFDMEWPPRSGKIQQFPEVDRAAWFSMEDARNKLIEAQQEFLSRLESGIQEETAGIQ